MDREPVSNNLPFDADFTFDADFISVRRTAAADDRRTRLAVTGELESSTSPVLEEIVAEALTRPAVDALELDLSEVTFIDSSGIHCLLLCREEAMRHGCRLVVTEAGPPVKRILEITALLDVFGIAAPVAETPARRVFWQTRAGNA